MQMIGKSKSDPDFYFFFLVKGKGGCGMTVDRLLPLTPDLEVATPAQPPRFLLVHVSHLFLFFFFIWSRVKGGCGTLVNPFVPLA